MVVEMCRTKHVLHAPDSEPPLDARGHNDFYPFNIDFLAYIAHDQSRWPEHDCNSLARRRCDSCEVRKINQCELPAGPMQVVLSESQKERSGAMRVESGKKIFLGTKSNRDDRAYLNVEVLYFLRAPTPKTTVLILCFFIICFPHGTPYTPRTKNRQHIIISLPLLIGC